LLANVLNQLENNVVSYEWSGVRKMSFRFPVSGFQFPEELFFYALF